MSHAYVYIHLVFVTKNRMTFLKKNEVREEMIRHIKNQAALKKFYLLEINGWHDHLHVLVRLKTSQRIQDIAQQLKGESSRWMSEKLGMLQFQWQKTYHAESVGKSELTRVRLYIQNQVSHHDNKTTV